MNNQNLKRYVVVCILSFILCVGIGFAAFSTSLDINGTGKVKSASWKIKFANLKPAELVGTATEETAPTISGEDTHIGDYKVTLTSPGDSVSYSFDIVNEGTFDAEITSLTVGTPNCEGTGDNALTDASNVCKNLTYTLTYSDGSNIKNGDSLEAGDSITGVTLTLTYSADLAANELPNNDVDVSGLATSIVYSPK